MYLLRMRKVTWHCYVIKLKLPVFNIKQMIGYHYLPTIYLTSLSNYIFVFSILGTSPMILLAQSIQYTRDNFTNIYWVSTIFKA